MVVGVAELARIIGCIFQGLGDVIPIITTTSTEARAHEEKVNNRFTKLNASVSFISKLLDDFEKKQFTENYVREWVNDLKEVAYDLDDLSDEIKTGIITSQYSKITVTTAEKEDIYERLQGISRKWNALKLIDGESRSKHSDSSNSTVEESDVYGREDEKRSLIKLLFDSNQDGDGMSVISIVGMGGIGKTTLAQLVYNDTSVKEKFEERVWVYVSQEFSVESITKSIYEKIMGTSSSSNDLSTLQEGLRERLAGRKFLIVLDDVWNRNLRTWEKLCIGLRTGRPGSRIIVTTRDETVASLVGSGHLTHRMKLLTNDDCLKILTQHATMSFKESDVASRLVEKCKGVPLAAMVLGGNLRSKEDKKWESTSESRKWDLAMKTHILPVLRWSYIDLPTHLKNLFAYCSLFPKEYKYDKNELVHLWMGEGFLEASKGELGTEYFDELLSRSFFQHVNSSDTKFVMHDHMHALAQSVGGKIYCCLNEKMDAMEEYQVPPGTRHFSFHRQKNGTFESHWFQGFSNVRGLRSFVAMPIESHCSHSYFPNKILVELVPQMQTLRVLSLSGYKSITELPDDICKLFHLRYLNLSGTSISTLPKSLGDLVNLHTLLIRDCRLLSKLPASLGNLLNLRHIDNFGTIALKDTPIEIVKLRKLRTMTEVVLGEGGCFGLKELGQLEHLSGSLCIRELQNVISREGVEGCLRDKKKLHELKLERGVVRESVTNEISAEEVLECLRPPEDLRVLGISGFHGLRFSSWIGDDSYIALSKVILENCRNCKCLPPLGQLSNLKELSISYMKNVTGIGDEFCGDGGTRIPFSKLEYLRLHEMPNLRKLCISGVGEGGVFSSLQKLEIVCSKLEHVSPLFLGSLQSLRLHHCSRVLLESFRALSSLTYFEASGMSGVYHLPRELVESLSSLQKLVISWCDELKWLWTEDTTLEHLTHLKRIEILHCYKLELLGHGKQHLPSKLEWVIK